MQAEAEAEALAEVFEVHAQELATKGDLRELDAKIGLKFEQVRGELKLLKWMVGLVIVAELLPLLKMLFA